MTTALLSVSGAQPLTFTMKDQAQTPQYKVPKFLRSLYSILENEDGAIVKWVQNQELKPNRVTAFHILDLERFEQEVLPKYFKHSKFASFQRQLNNFGFRKWTKTQSSGVCTFSHNCFPPDPRETGVLRASIREQWRQKNTDSRRRVGNGITKAERKLQQLVQQSVQLQQQKKDKTHSSPVKKINTLATDSDDDVSCVGIESPSRVESFSDMLKTPLEPAYNRAPTHQPQLKKLARPMNGEWVSGSGLEAFAEGPVKSTMLPPIHTHHLPHVSYNNTINIGTYPAQSDIYQTKMELPPLMDASAAPSAPHMMMMSATQLEPWAWTPHAASATYDIHHFPMDVAAWPHHHGPQALHGPIVDPSLAHKGVYCQQASPSTMEEFSFDSLMLFAE